MNLIVFGTVGLVLALASMLVKARQVAILGRNAPARQERAAVVAHMAAGACIVVEVTVVVVVAIVVVL